MIRLRRILPSVIAGVCIVIYLFPLYWMAISGFKTQSEIFADPPSFFPRAPTLDAFRYVVGHENMARYVRNSVAIALPVTLVAVTLSAMGAYAMSRLRSRMIDAALITVLLLQVFPEALLATPIFIIFKSLGLLNSYLAVILATSARAVAFGLIILRPMFSQVPFELEEASYVDGCSDWQTFSRIVLPLMRVPLLVLAAITFAQAYGQFVYPLTLLNRQELQPGTAGIYSFIGAEIADWHRVMAFCRAVRTADRTAVRGVAASDRVRAYRRRVEVIQAPPVANCNRECRAPRRTRQSAPGREHRRVQAALKSGIFQSPISDCLSQIVERKLSTDAATLAIHHDLQQPSSD